MAKNKNKNKKSDSDESDLNDADTNPQIEVDEQIETQPQFDRGNVISKSLTDIKGHAKFHKFKKGK